MFVQHAGVLDVISYATQQRICLVLPTLLHAIELWPRYTDALEERAGTTIIKRTKTARIVVGTPGILRLWVPYEREPTQPMDFHQVRAGWDFISPYYRRDVMPE